jgi:hypothetical protein
VRIIQGEFDSTVEAFGASRRLATRLNALARRGLLVTETILEVALEDDGKPLRDVLLGKGLLDAAETLDTPALKKLAKGQFFKDNALAVVANGEHRVLCLEEEADSDDPVTPPREGSGALAAVEGGLPSVIDRNETRRLLGSDETSRLKLDLVTSSEAGRRLEAVRKLFLSELPAHEKVRLFLTALRDREADVRAEAARALGGLGLDGALTENLAKATRGATPERVVAITNISRILPRLEKQQNQLALALLIEFLNSAEDADVVNAAIGVLVTRIGELDSLEGITPGVHKKLFELLQVKLSLYEDAARRLYSTLYKRDREHLSNLLSLGVAEESQAHLRFFLLSLITEHDLAAAAAPAVVRQLIAGLSEGSELDRNYQACTAALARLGEKAVPGLLQALQESNDAAKERIIDLLGHLLRVGDKTEYPVSAKSAARIARACLDLYVESGTEVATALLESGFFEHPSLDDSAREEAVRAFIDSLHEFRFERQIELVQTALVRCGHMAIDPLAEAMRESAHDITRLTAAKLLPEIIEHDKAVTTDKLTELIGIIRKQIDDEDSDFPDRGPLYVALGRLGAHANTPGTLANELANLLRERVGMSSNVYDILEGMGWLAAGENLNKEERLETGHLLLGVLKKGLPGMSAKLRANKEGEMVLHFGRETTAYTDMIPRILVGLGRMVAAPKTPKPLFEAIATDLVRLWDEITQYKRIWAPAATITLARLLGDIALGNRRADRMADDIAELLSRKLILLPVMQVLSRLAIVQRDSERMDLIAQRAFNELAKRLNEEPAPEVSERRQILETMAAIAKRKRLGERDKDIEHARNVVVEAAFDAMRDKLFQARLILEDLAGSSALSDTMRNDISRRLKPSAQR